MAFNLYFAGVQSNQSEALLEKRNLLRLLSYYNDRREFEKRSAKGFKTFLDSGAFSAWTRGVHIDIDEYIKYVNEWDESLQYFIQLDEIPGEPEREHQAKSNLTSNLSEQVRKDAQEQTYKNFLYMEQHVKSPQKLVPVFHKGSDFSCLQRLLDHRPKVSMIGLGALVGAPRHERKKFLDKVFEIIENSSYPDVKVHALGMTDLSLLETYPLYSADSTSWLQATANHNLLTREFGTVNVSSRVGNSKTFRNIWIMSEEERNKVAAKIEGYGYTLESVADNYRDRSCTNINFLQEWADNYVLHYKRPRQKTLF